MKKILIVASVYSHIAQFHQSFINVLKDKEYEIHIAGRNNLNEKPNLTLQKIDRYYDYNFTRNPVSIRNLKLISIMKKQFDIEKYDLIYTHTPAASVITRLAAKNTRKNNNTKVIYMAHGFHFHKEAPLINWIVYYPIEKLMTRHTDVLITINSEDYEWAKRKFNKCQIEYVNGVGIDFSKYDINKTNKYIREEYNIPKEAKVITTIGELNDNKNQMFVLKSLKDKLKKEDFYYLIVGNGPNEEKYKKYITDNNLSNNVILTGYRRDVSQILNETNIVVSVSKREGLPINVLEAMYMNKKIILSDNRGHRELAKRTDVIQLIDLKDKLSKILFINEIMKSNNTYDEKIMTNEYSKIYKNYHSSIVNSQLLKILERER